MDNLNLYDTLRAIVRATNWRSEIILNDHLNVINEAERMNVFGNVAAEMDGTLHKHSWSKVRSAWPENKTLAWKCSVCDTIIDNQFPYPDKEAPF